MIGTVFSSTLKDFLRPQRFVPWASVVGIVYVIAKIWTVLAVDLSSDDSFRRVQQAVVLHVAALAAAVFGTFVLSQEVEQGTIVYLITRPVRRAVLLLGRMGAAALASYLVAAFSLVAAALAILGPQGLSPDKIGVDLVVLLLGVLAYTGFFVFLSLSVARPLIVSLLFAFGWETFVPNMPGDMFYASVLTYMRSAAPRAGVAGQPSLGDVITGALAPKTVPQGAAWLALVGLTFLTWTLCQWRFKRFEHSPREEGG